MDGPSGLTERTERHLLSVGDRQLGYLLTRRWVVQSYVPVAFICEADDAAIGGIDGAYLEVLDVTKDVSEL